MRRLLALATLVLSLALAAPAAARDVLFVGNKGARAYRVRATLDGYGAGAVTLRAQSRRE